MLETESSNPNVQRDKEPGPSTPGQLGEFEDDKSVEV